MRSKPRTWTTLLTTLILALSSLVAGPALAQGRRAPPSETPPPPPPPRPNPPPAAGPQILTTSDQCVRLVAAPDKRQRCFECVNQNRRYDRQGGGWGYCYPNAAPPAPPAPPPVGRVCLTREECVDRVMNLEKRTRCIDCVNGGGKFHITGDGPGHCKTPPPPPAPTPPPPDNPVSVTVGDCNAKAPPPPKLRRCVDCVRAGGKFYHQGWKCEMPPPPPAPPPAPPAPPSGFFISQPRGCHHAAIRHELKNACRECTRTGGRFTPDGACHR
jgi:hypothetical protein